MEKNKKVLLGMSGGVDSSVSAVLLKEEGYEVIGTTLELYAGSSCCNINTYLDAKLVCKKVGVPHFTFDCKEEFRNLVIQDFIDCYSNCKTPNPCIECNKFMKFGLMYEKAKEMDCYYIATGHYAKTEFSEKYNCWVLKKSKAGKKDQSYVLWNIPKELIEHVLFPLGDFESKDQIRALAAEKNLKVASKPDSEDICFIPDGDYAKFLENNSNLKPKQGKIVDSKETVLGTHKGLYNYTIGQRKGLGISHPTPLFVLGFDYQKNELIVGEQEELYKDEFEVYEINLLLQDKLTEPVEVEVKTRYSSKQVKATITQIGEDRIKVKLAEPARAITPGQSAVFYVDGDIVLRRRKNIIGAFEKYIEEIKENIARKEGISEIEIVRYVYISLGRKMNFDTNYTFGNRKQKERIYNTRLDDQEFDRLFEKRTAICKSMAYMLKRILEEFDIKVNIIKDSYYEQNQHVYNRIELKDGRTFEVDLEEDLELIQTGSKTHFFGLTEKSNWKKQDLVSEEELRRIDKTTAEYIPWGFYFDDMLRTLRFATKGMTTEEKLKNVLDNLDVYVNDSKMGYRDRIYYHNRMLQEVFSEKELKKVHQIDCYREEQGERKYVSCVVLEQSNTDNVVYLYSDELGRYEEIGLEELAKEVKAGLVPMHGVQGLRKHLKSDTRKEEKEEKKKTISITFPKEEGR
ncbi:MAG: tRNA 2-thiouridine(34) synthase MnmA [Clostridia bacterium]|nr:tRNA 2-thiouridine(34) synthase MnmA [Clostridia bacterium]